MEIELKESCPVKEKEIGSVRLKSTGKTDSADSSGRTSLYTFKHRLDSSVNIITNSPRAKNPLINTEMKSALDLQTFMTEKKKIRICWNEVVFHFFWCCFVPISPVWRWLVKHTKWAKEKQNAIWPKEDLEHFVAHSTMDSCSRFVQWLLWCFFWGCGVGIPLVHRVTTAGIWLSTIAIYCPAVTYIMMALLRSCFHVAAESIDFLEKYLEHQAGEHEAKKKKKEVEESASKEAEEQARKETTTSMHQAEEEEEDKRGEGEKREEEKESLSKPETNPRELGEALLSSELLDTRLHWIIQIAIVNTGHAIVRLRPVREQVGNHRCDWLVTGTRKHMRIKTRMMLQDWIVIAMLLLIFDALMIRGICEKSNNLHQMAGCGERPPWLHVEVWPHKGILFALSFLSINFCGGCCLKMMGDIRKRFLLLHAIVCVFTKLTYQGKPERLCTKEELHCELVNELEEDAKKWKGKGYTKLQPHRDLVFHVDRHCDAVQQWFQTRLHIKNDIRSLLGISAYENVLLVGVGGSIILFVNLCIAQRNSLKWTVDQPIAFYVLGINVIYYGSILLLCALQTEEYRRQRSQIRYAQFSCETQISSISSTTATASKQDELKLAELKRTSRMLDCVSKQMTENDHECLSDIPISYNVLKGLASVLISAGTVWINLQ
jgi:hypothetical protein